MSSSFDSYSRETKLCGYDSIAYIPHAAASFPASGALLAKYNHVMTSGPRSVTPRDRVATAPLVLRRRQHSLQSLRRHLSVLRNLAVLSHQVMVRNDSLVASNRSSEETPSRPAFGLTR